MQTLEREEHGLCVGFLSPIPICLSDLESDQNQGIFPALGQVVRSKRAAVLCGEEERFAGAARVLAMTLTLVRKLFSRGLANFSMHL